MNLCASKLFKYLLILTLLIITLLNSSDYDLADDSADIVYQAYTYNAARGYRFCRWTHACVACPIINQSCSFFRGRRSESDVEDSDSEDRRRRDAEDRRETGDEDEVPEEWE